MHTAWVAPRYPVPMTVMVGASGPCGSAATSQSLVVSGVGCPLV